MHYEVLYQQTIDVVGQRLTQGS